ncbi:Senescence-associated carboxylesterase 101 [Heracleum sosnowskyi]|uniref:Senescence-associated carboxylesterase 101 n=1 Tax=Heracleum sosnowskyi TaxID=360622 RepID=A0AAD8JIP4_9APIA|nr:Senescence-associated carboxylesterase 101 [Heracleum sosnowskyi]
MNQFNHEEELGNHLVSSDLPWNCWAHILKVNQETPQVGNPSLLPQTVKYKRFDPQSPGDATVIAFTCSPTSISSDVDGEGQRLVSSADLNSDHFNFLSTTSNPSFSIHNLALQLFRSLPAQLFEQKIDTTKPLIITGHSLGGSVASLFTLWLLNNSYKKIVYRQTKFPICLTFGSPLLGDEGLQKAILGRPSWASCFVHVVSTQDPLPGLFLSRHTTIDSEFKSFGLYLFCSGSGVACFSQPEFVLELLGSSLNQPFNDYGLILEGLKGKAIVRGTNLAGFDNNSLRTGITLQLQAIGIPDMQNNDLIRRIETKQKESLEHKAYQVGLDANLKKMKTEMAYMEWYKKLTRTLGGYYDTYKSATTSGELRSRASLVKHQRILTRCWTDAVNEAKKTDGKDFLFRLLMAGNNYRRMVEPLDIAEYYKGYKQGQKDYWAEGRSEHYILLEKWLNEMPSAASQRTKACSFNEDSCFWAHVEEALILVSMLSNEESSPENEEVVRKLNQFEDYIMDSIVNHILDPEVFLEQSSFMKWWSKYSAKKGSSYDSPLANYMRDKSYEALLKC